jgi:hypothetical protein
MTPVIAHAGHWLAGLLYFAPVLLVVGALWWQSRRSRDEDDEDLDDLYDDDLEESARPGPAAP